MIKQCAIIFGCLSVGEFIVMTTGIKLPSSIIGMLLLTLLLKMGWVKVGWVKGFSDLLLNNLAFLFVPAGVSLMYYFNLLKASFWPIFVSAIMSTIIVLVVTGWVHQIMRKKQ